MHSEALHAGGSEFTSHQEYVLIVACSPDLIAAGSEENLPVHAMLLSQEAYQEKQKLSY